MIESRISYAWRFWPLWPCHSVVMPASLLRSAAKSPHNRQSVSYAFNLTSYLCTAKITRHLAGWLNPHERHHNPQVRVRLRSNLIYRYLYA